MFQEETQLPPPKKGGWVRKEMKRNQKEVGRQSRGRRRRERIKKRKGKQKCKEKEKKKKREGRKEARKEGNANKGQHVLVCPFVCRRVILLWRLPNYWAGIQELQVLQRVSYLCAIRFVLVRSRAVQL